MNILIVDDSKVMRAIIIRTLRQAGFEGHTIDQADDGQTALERIDACRPDLVLTDWNMPGMDGIELLRSVRAQGMDMPFVLITSEATEEMHALAYREGVAGVITKPITVESFEAQLGGDYSLNEGLPILRTATPGS